MQKKPEIANQKGKKQKYRTKICKFCESMQKIFFEIWKKKNIRIFVDVGKRLKCPPPYTT